jgi:hypothetical protein
VFFVIHCSSKKADDMIELKSMIEDHLKSMFLDTGDFLYNELYNNCVFYFSEECESFRTDKKEAESLELTNMISEPFEKAQIDPDNKKQTGRSGFDALVNSLSEYLLTEERIAMGFLPLFSVIPCIWVKADRVIKSSISFLTGTYELSDETLLLSDNELARAKEELTKIIQTFKTTAKLITAKIYSSMLNYIYSLESSWEADLEKIDRKSGLLDALKSMPSDTPVDINEINDLIIKESKEYISVKSEDWSIMQELLIKPEISDLHNEIYNTTGAILLKLQKALYLFSGSIGEQEHFIPNNLQSDHRLAGIAFIKPGYQSEKCAVYNVTWEEIFRKKILCKVITLMTHELFSVDFEWLTTTVAEAFLKKTDEGDMNKLFSYVKSRFFQKRKETLEEQQAILESMLQKEFEEQGNWIMEVLHSMIDDERNRQAVLLSQKRLLQSGQKVGPLRFDTFLQEFLRRINPAFEAVYGKCITEEELFHLAGAL